jgi:guanine deaminase
MNYGCPPITLEPLALTPTLDHPKYLRMAQALARKAALGEKCGNLYGAVVVQKKDGLVMGEGYDSVYIDPTGTAGISAIRISSRLLKTADLSGCVMYLSAYPPLIDSFAILQANIHDVFYASSTSTEKQTSTVINKTTYHPIPLP